MWPTGSGHGAIGDGRGATVTAAGRRAAAAGWRRGALGGLAALVLAVGGLVGCGEDPSEDLTTIRVPDDAATLAEAAAMADPGDLILLAPGVYEESVTIEDDGVEVRGLDRNEVVLDGGDDLPNGVTLAADDVVVRNLTVRNYTANGVYAYGVDGFHVGQVTAADNGLYGIYALDSRYGTITGSYAGGHPDSGIYVGQCDPCDVLVEKSTAEANNVGFLATNASDGLWVVESTWRANRVGVEVSSQDAERLAPQHDAQVRANLVEDNADDGAPGPSTSGVGILVDGGQDDVVADNVVSGHPVGGIVVTDLPDGFLPRGTKVHGNVVEGPGPGLVYALVAGTVDADDPAGPAGVCFSDNDLAGAQGTVPDELEDLAPCPEGGPDAFSDDRSLFPEPVRAGDDVARPLPPDQPGLDDPEGAPRLEIAHEPLVLDGPFVVPAA